MKNATTQTKIANVKTGVSKFAMMAVMMLSVFAAKRAGATFHYITTLSSAANQVAAVTNCGGQSKIPVYGFSLAVSSNGGGAAGTLPTMTNVVLNTTNVASDVTRLQLWCSTTNSLSGATQLGSDITTSLGSGNHNFSFAAKTLNDSTTYYFWVTADISATAAQNDSITTTAITASSITYGVAPWQAVGSATNGGTQTINAMPSITATSAAMCGAGVVTLNATPSAGTVAWFTGNTGGTAIASGTSYAASVSSTTTYYAGVTSNGCTNPTRAAATATINSVPTAAPSAATICTGSTATLTANPANGANTYSWSGLNLSSASAQNPTATPTVTSVYSLTVTNGTTNPGCSSSYTTTVTVASLPTAAPTNSGAICTGATASLSANATGAISYTWSGANLSSTTGANPTATPTTTTTYSLTVSNAVCTASVTYTTTVTVNANPTASPATTAVMCGSTATLTANAAGGTGSYTYNWSGANLSSTTVANPTTTSTGTYTLTVTASGCSSNPYTIVTTVNPAPAAFSVTGGGGYCPGTAVPHVNLSGSATGVNYKLYRSGTLVATLAGTGSALDFGQRGAGFTFTIVGVDATNGCTTNMTGSTTITLLAVPTMYTVTGGGAYCSGGTGVHVGLSNSDATATYQLYNATSPVGSPLSGTGAALDFGLQTAAGTAYTIVATSNATGCTKATTSSVGVTVNPAPWAFSVTGGGSYCTGASGVAVGLYSTVSNTTYQLFKSAGSGSAPASIVGSSVSGSGSAISFGAQTAAGVYSVIATNTITGCTGTMSGTVVVSVNAIPSVSSSISTVAPSASIALSASVSGGTWSSSNTAAATIDGSGNVTGVALGTTVISYTASTGCVGTETVNVTATGFRSAAEGNNASEVSNAGIEVSAVPNPNNGVFTVKGSVAGNDENVYVDVTNVAGQVVYQQALPVANGQIDQQVQLNGSVANGMYLLSVRTKSESKVIRIAVAK